MTFLKDFIQGPLEILSRIIKDYFERTSELVFFLRILETINFVEIYNIIFTFLWIFFSKIKDYTFCGDFFCKDLLEFFEDFFKNPWRYIRELFNIISKEVKSYILKIFLVFFPRIIITIKTDNFKYVF